MDVAKREVRVKPQYAYDITGLTAEELMFIRDMMGKFASSCGEGEHFHSVLYRRLVKTLDCHERIETDLRLIGDLHVPALYCKPRTQ